MAAPLVALAVGAVVAGLLQPPFASIMQSIFPLTEAANANALALEVVAVVVSLLGIALAYALFGRRRLFAQRVAESSGGHALHRFWFGGWGFDWLYQVLLVRPFVWLADINRADAIDKLYDGVAALTEFLHRLARRTQNGRVRWYAAAMIAGALAILTWAVWP
jgi:NADH-quinone oxidoreductase subunit L